MKSIANVMQIPIVKKGNLLKSFFEGILLTLFVYLLSLIGYYRYVLSHEGDVILYLKNILEISPFKVLLMCIPAIAGGIPEDNKTIWFSINGSYHKRSCLFKTVVKKSAVQYLLGGMCAAMGLIIFFAIINFFVPIVTNDVNRYGELMYEFHDELYLGAKTLDIALFHASLVFAVSGFISVVYMTIYNISKNSYVSFPLSFLILQVISLCTNILKFPNQYRFSQIYSGNFSISSAIWLDSLWAILLYVTTGFLFVLLQYVYTKRYNYAKI